ncbi:hypothetical protein ACIBCD_38390 [Nocardia brasiliensis]|uniref:hypothetical protein n=1 Tax=Nocardia brasiliensis TaxID=37326 RepID=UPI00245411D1|nr:hypothetical protein [Nocardia brasiliensis]
MPISFDISGLQQMDTNTWGDHSTGDIVTLTYHDLVPDLPAPLEDLDTLRTRLAESSAESGCLVEAFLVWVDKLPGLLRIEKLPLPNRDHGLVFAASIVVPKDRCSAVFQILCPEFGTTGLREAALLAQLGPQHMFPPHPYAPGLRGKLPYNIADEVRWDAQFPDHPVSRARRWVARTVPTAKVDPGFAALPPFPGPQT